MEGWGRNFEEALIWKVGTGKEVLFWEDNWVGRGALKTVFPMLYSLSVPKASGMTAFGGWNNEKWLWNFVWRRNLFEWEKQIAKRLFQEVQGVNFDLDKEDR